MKLSNGKKILLGVVVILIIISTFSVGYATYLMSKINKVEIDREDVVSKSEDVPKEVDDFITIALFGTDYMGTTIGSADTMMLLSIDVKNKKIKLCSLMRDMYVDLPEGGKMNLNYTILEEGPAYLLKTINHNFDLKIDKFVQVDLTNLPKIIDILGGVEIDITSDEMAYINGYIKGIDSENGTKTQPIAKSGKQLLNGVQATAYCRIRYTEGRDFKRTERQRDVLEILFNKMKDISITQIPGVISELLPLVSTNMTNSEMISIGTTVVSNGITSMEQGRFPLDTDQNMIFTDMYHMITDMDKTKKEIHKFLYAIEYN